MRLSEAMQTAPTVVIKISGARGPMGEVTPALQELADEAAASAAIVGDYAAILSPRVSRPGFLFEFVDSFRRIIAFIDTANIFTVSRVKASFSYLLGDKGRAIADSFDSTLFFGVFDPARRAYFTVRKDGIRARKVCASEIQTDTINGVAAGAYQTLFSSIPALPDNTTREAVVATGQSLSEGTGSTEPGDGSNPPIALTTDQPYGNLMPTGGVRPYLTAAPDPWVALVPHVEAADVPNSCGETILGGFQAMVAQLFNRFGYAPSDHFLRTVVASVGQGETAIAAFRQGASSLFARVTDTVQHIEDLTPGEVLKARSVLWLQGESDGATSEAAYAANLVGLANETDVAVRAVTGQIDPVVLLSYQIDRPKIGLAQQDAARSARLVQIAAPMYWVEWAGLRGANFDLVHRSAEGYKRLGACFAVAWFCQNILKHPWRPLQLALDARGRLDCTVDGTDLIVRYHVPHSGVLEFDDVVQINTDGTPLKIAARQRGFRLFDDDGVTEKPLRDVVLEGRDRVRLVGANPVANDILRVGFTDPTSHDPASAVVNLRDRQGDVITFDDLGGLPVHNWALIESHQLTAEELAA
jgi:hypothetical protein